MMLELETLKKVNLHGNVRYQILELLTTPVVDTGGKDTPTFVDLYKNRPRKRWLSKVAV